MLKITGIILGMSGLLIGCKEKEAKEETTDKKQEADVVEEDKVNEDNVNDTKYISKDGKIEIELPNETWVCTDDSGDNITISSEEGVINIMRNEGDAVATQLVDNQGEYEAQIKGFFADVQFEVISFDKTEEEGRTGYRSVIKYVNNEPDYYMVGMATYNSMEGYTVAATLYKDDTQLLKKTENSVFTMKVLK